MDQIIRYGLIGYKGKLGREVEKLFDDTGHKLVFTSDLDGEQESGKPQVLIDCSLPEAFNSNIQIVEKYGCPFIIAVTGLTDENLKTLQDLSQKSSVVQSFNFSVGIQVLLKLTETAAHLLNEWDVEITETHHRHKKDKPSGTAKMIKEILKDRNVNVSSLRLGGIPGDHTVEFGAMGETLRITHHVISRRTFAEGILRSAEFVLRKDKGFYTFKDVVFED